MSTSEPDIDIPTACHTEPDLATTTTNAVGTQTDPPQKRKCTPTQRAALEAARNRYNAGRTHLKMEKMRLTLLGYVCEG